MNSIFKGKPWPLNLMWLPRIIITNVVLLPPLIFFIALAAVLELLLRGRLMTRTEWRECAGELWAIERTVFMNEWDS